MHAWRIEALDIEAEARDPILPRATARRQAAAPRVAHDGVARAVNALELVRRRDILRRISASSSSSSSSSSGAFAPGGTHGLLRARQSPCLHPATGPRGHPRGVPPPSCFELLAAAAMVVVVQVVAAAAAVAATPVAPPLVLLVDAVAIAGVARSEAALAARASSGAHASAPGFASMR